MRILFVHQALPSFVEKDLRILASAHEVREFHFTGVSDVPGLFRGIVWCDICFCWFGKIHAFFSVLFCRTLRKKSAVVAGGDEVAKVPEIGYGLFSSWWKRYCPLFVFRYADLTLCVSESNRRETLVNAKPNPGKVRVVFHGFDGDLFKNSGSGEKEDTVITIGRITEENLARKGLELFVRCASLLPRQRFLLIGFHAGDAIDRLRRLKPANLEFTGEVSMSDLIHTCSRARVYVQASMHEGFGCSVAEAMLCECVPVVSRRGSLPEVVGDCGLYVDDLDPEELAARIREALASDVGQRARERVLQRFPLEGRRAALLDAVQSLGEGHLDRQH